MSLSPGGTPVGASAAPVAADLQSSIVLRMRRGAGWFLMIWQGYSASRELAQMQQAAQAGLSQPRLP